MNVGFYVICLSFKSSSAVQKLCIFLTYFDENSILWYYCNIDVTVKILKIGTPEIITIIVLQLEQLDFTVQYCVQKMQTE